jgi:hypothetical protein
MKRWSMEVVVGAPNEILPDLPTYAVHAYEDGIDGDYVLHADAVAAVEATEREVVEAIKLTVLALVESAKNEGDAAEVSTLLAVAATIESGLWKGIKP